MNATSARKLMPALLASRLGACLSDPEDRASLIGEPLSALKGAKAAVAVDGRLYVANRDSAATGIAVVDLASGEITAFHESSLPPNELALASDSVLVVAESDYQTGALSRLSLKTGAWTPEYLAVGSDNALVASGDKVFLMERSRNVVTGFTAGRLEEANVFLNVNTGEKSNPYQVALHGGSAFVTRYGSSHLLVLEAGEKPVEPGFSVHDLGSLDPVGVERAGGDRHRLPRDAAFFERERDQRRSCATFDGPNRHGTIAEDERAQPPREPSGIDELREMPRARPGLDPRIDAGGEPTRVRPDV